MGGGLGGGLRTHTHTPPPSLPPPCSLFTPHPFPPHCCPRAACGAVAPPHPPAPVPVLPLLLLLITPSPPPHSRAPCPLLPPTPPLPRAPPPSPYPSTSQGHIRPICHPAAEPLQRRPHRPCAADGRAGCNRGSDHPGHDLGPPGRRGCDRHAGWRCVAWWNDGGRCASQRFATCTLASTLIPQRAHSRCEP